MVFRGMDLDRQIEDVRKLQEQTEIALGEAGFDRMELIKELQRITFEEQSGRNIINLL